LKIPSGGWGHLPVTGLSEASIDAHPWKTREKRFKKKLKLEKNISIKKSFLG